MMPHFKSRIEQALNERENSGLTRRLQLLERSAQGELIQQDRTYLNFSSNDYLGLASDAELVQAWQTGLARFGAGSGASPMVTGFSSAHAELEHELCHWLGYERAILFSSGFSANQALLFTLLEKEDLLLQDKLNHASLMEAGMLSPATMKRFKHNDTDHLRQLLNEQSNCLVVTEGVFSMDGDCAPLEQIAAAVKPRAWLMVDDAHGIGVLGEHGAGSCQAAGIHPDILIVTFGKAFGLAGAAVLCDAQVGDYLTQFARHHVYSTAIPPAQAHALTHAVRMIQRQSWRREKLAELMACFDEWCSDTPGYVSTSTPIKPWLLGGSESAMAASYQLKQQGIWVSAIRPPTVPVGSARLRITLTATHSKQQVRNLSDQLKRVMEDCA
ncbi:8-amino-7-oxononanoate synthase [Vibrio cholerae]|uniref:8-amino-7-oxononanoate synthase n=1 Tax=Vibrio cholerae TaxID=666 RepID=UPI0013732759|nr:8-amino-7-oxononanoate synthase [Vibrio cholerae]EGR4408175.1 8-amino-7-oxononanoate synthase [Vibrio cholerae]EJL9434008.1 8-amino-7-oxononanoate synthase [Vibrio cholerae]EKF9101261.1 8-amino-7-oxononanoate synthase [Vibrio cholerae]ELJ8495352.1 8-amino-7-oxononanoate synthase [Vibrio cholerae]ELJ8498507.1 8-amino-7-oxononanoate synthase [Vibrio cholerae]